MIIDAHAYLGPWAPYRLPQLTARELVAEMDRTGVERAVVASTPAVLYRNVQPGNVDLAAEAAEFGERLIPFATINPTYPRWQEDLADCVEKLGQRGVRLHPVYHNYAMDDPHCLELLKEAAQRGLPVSVSLALESQGQHHWLMKLSALDRPAELNEQIIRAIRAVPEATLILLQVGSAGFSAYDYKRILRETEAPVGRLYFGISMALGAPLKIALDELAPIAADRFVFTAQMPFKYVDPTRLLVESLPLAAAQKERIYSGNLLEVLPVQQ